jgi:hypothetical protein
MRTLGASEVAELLHELGQRTALLLLSSHRLPNRDFWEDCDHLKWAKSLKVLVPPGEFESPTS